MTHHAVAAQILNDHAMLNDAFDGKRILSEDGIAIDIAPIGESTAYAMKYLHLFESSRLGNNLTSEDQLFSRVVEKMISDWMLDNHHDWVTWNGIKEGVKKGWDKTKDVTKSGWDKTKDITKSGWDKTKNLVGKKDPKKEETPKNHDGIWDTITGGVKSGWNKTKDVTKSGWDKTKNLVGKKDPKKEETPKKHMLSKKHQLDFETYLALHEFDHNNHKGFLSFVKGIFGGNKKPEGEKKPEDEKKPEGGKKPEGEKKPEKAE